MTGKQKKWFGVLTVALLIGVMAAAFFLIGVPMVKFVRDPDGFAAWRQQQGAAAPLIYLLMIALQVIVAVIPGEPFEICAGFAFGNVGGTLICLGGIVLGSIVIFLLVRRWGVKLVEIFFSTKKINSLKFLRSARKRNTLIFLLMMIPGTPKDLLTWFVGLTDVKLTEWAVIAAVARIPSVLSSVVGGSLIARQQYLFALLVFAVTGLISIIGLLLYNSIMKKREQSQ